MATGTTDVRLKQWRVKLGSGGYTSCASAGEPLLAEGEFTFSKNGGVEFVWSKCISFADGEWVPNDPQGLLASLELLDDDIKAVGENETAETLWGGKLTDPITALEKNGFKMRRVVLTSKPRYQNEK